MLFWALILVLAAGIILICFWLLLCLSVWSVESADRERWTREREERRR